ncbi:carbohydrate ABC transporter permease [Kribbella sindirgiensis]|uniref:Sugar ABC transporter permease n=1 Tax=Kribbella sindirgiensis TaxID=1124744 RepID=A0A4R0IU22_9ACTN|nr:sugar ABC transporter permease [Kribbella sindirgiensis]TCC32215.1 sugar ABC transporter permease [Kribbella sindirgiensis]
MTNLTLRRPEGVADGLRRPAVRRKLARRDTRIGFLFLLPLFAGLLVFRFYGFGYNVWLSFNKAGAFGRARFTGLDNYERLFSDSQLRIALVNTFKFTAIVVPGVVVVSLLCATLMQYRFRGQSAFRAIVFLPAVCLPTAAILLFGWLFQTRYGLINAIIQAAGGSSVSWFGSSAGVTVVITVIVVFLSFSVPTIILYAGMQEISSDIYEAATIDGAGSVRRFFSLTLPLLSPSLFFVVLTTTIGTLKLFDVAYVLLPPEQSASVNFGLTAVYYYYQLAFLNVGDRGYASAVSLLLFVLILAVSIVLFRLQRRFVHYGEDG